MPLRVGPPFGASPPESGSSTPIFTTVGPVVLVDDPQAVATSANTATKASGLGFICRILHSCSTPWPGTEPPGPRDPPLAPGSPAVGRLFGRPAQALCGSLLRQRTDATNRCLLYTSPSPRDGLLSRMPSS